MKEVTSNNFGVVIAFLLPGFLFLWGLSYSSNEVALWLARIGNQEGQTVGGFLYVTLASLASGLLISAIRWLVIDHALWGLGISGDKINFANLSQQNVFAAFQGVVENHYRYYQYYSNTLVAIVLAFAIYVKWGREKLSISIYISALLIVVTLFLASRDSLKKYYDRAKQILGTVD